MQLYLFRKRGLRTVRTRIGKNGQAFVYGVERIMTAGRAAKLFTAHGLKVKSFRYFRIASSKLGKLADKKAIGLIGIEKKVCSIPFFARFFSLHYNIVFKR